MKTLRKLIYAETLASIGLVTLGFLTLFMFFDLVDDPGECRDLSADPGQQARVEKWRQRLAQVNEERGDPRGQGGRLVAQPDGALALSPNYNRWKERAAEVERAWRG